MRPMRNNLNVQNAKKSAVEYCKKNGFKVEKLNSQVVHSINGKVIFAQPIKRIGRTGLRTDKSTMPKPTLVVEKTEKGYVVSPTSDAEVYLK